MPLRVLEGFDAYAGGSTFAPTFGSVQWAVTGMAAPGPGRSYDESGESIALSPGAILAARLATDLNPGVHHYVGFGVHMEPGAILRVTAGVDDLVQFAYEFGPDGTVRAYAGAFLVNSYQNAVPQANVAPQIRSGRVWFYFDMNLLAAFSGGTPILQSVGYFNNVHGDTAYGGSLAAHPELIVPGRGTNRLTFSVSGTGAAWLDDVMVSDDDSAPVVVVVVPPPPVVLPPVVLPPVAPLPDYAPDPLVTPWTIRPNWRDGVTERLQWLTDVLISQSGAEQRRRLRQSPRRVIEANYTLWGDRRRLYDSYMAGPQAGVWRVPLWWEKNRLLLPADPASRSLTFAFPGSEITAGDTVMVAGDDPFTCDLALVSGTGDGGVVLATKLARSWPKGASVYPTRKCLLAGSQSAKRRSDGATEVQLQFQTVEPNDFAPVAPLGNYHGFPVMGIRPDWAQDMTFEHQRMLALFDNQTGVLARRDTGLRAFPVQQFSYTARGRADQAALRALLYYFCGRLRPVWLPTFMRDVELAPGLALDAGASIMTVRRSGYSEFGTGGPVGSHTGRTVLMIFYRDGWLTVRAIQNYLLIDAESESLQLDGPLDRPTSDATMLRMSYMQLMRQDQDEATLLHVADAEGATQLTTTFRACDVARVAAAYQPWAPYSQGESISGGAGGTVTVLPDRSQGTAGDAAPVDALPATITGNAG